MVQQGRPGGGKVSVLLPTKPFVARKRPGWPAFVALVVALLGGGCHKNKPPSPPPPVVEYITVTPKDVPIFTEWIGTLDGFVNATIRAQVTGYLLSQNYVEGSEVKKGDLLFQIDPRPFQASLDQAKGKLAQDEAQLRRTELDVERYAPLAKVNAISRQELDNAVQANLSAKAAVQADQAAVELANLNLEFTKIISPIDGLAGIAQAQIGDLVNAAGQVLTTISTLDPIKVYFTATEQSYLAYRRQFATPQERKVHERELEFQLFLADGSLYAYLGKFYTVGREVDPRTGTITAECVFPNPNFVLRPGQFARVRAKTQTRRGALTVPQQAVSQLQGSYQVALINPQDIIHLQTVRVGAQVGPDWVIEQGVKAGDRVVVEGVQKAKEGTKVNPRPLEVAAKGGAGK